MRLIDATMGRAQDYNVTFDNVFVAETKNLSIEYVGDNGYRVTGEFDNIIIGTSVGPKDPPLILTDKLLN